MANQTFSDDFNSTSQWTPVRPWAQGGIPDAGSWMPNPNNLPSDGNPISDNNGVMTLSEFARPSDVSSSQTGGLDRIGGQMVTAGKFAQTYGYYEASIQMPAGHGEAGAFWLLPQSGAWPPEIDIAEVWGNTPKVLVTTMWDGGGDMHSTWHDTPDLTSGFHTYGMDWEPDNLTWYFDNKEVYQQPTPSDMHQPMYMNLTVNSGLDTGAISWLGAADPNSTSQMKVDWVHVYDSKPDGSGSSGVSGQTTQSDTTGQTTSQSDTSSSQPASDPNSDNSIVKITSGMLDAQPNTTFLYDGSGHNTTINNFSPTDVLDFEGTSLGFNDISINKSHHGVNIDFDGNHIRLPGVSTDNLSPSNFMINGQSETTWSA